MKLFLKPKTLTNKSLKYIRRKIRFNGVYTFDIRATKKDYNLIDDDIYLQLGYYSQFNFEQNNIISIIVAKDINKLDNLRE